MRIMVINNDGVRFVCPKLARPGDGQTGYRKFRQPG